MELNPIGLKFAIIDRSFKKRMDEYAKELGLTSVQLRVLAEINRMEETNPEKEINQKDLENLEKVSHPTMSVLITQLEKKGFIKCKVSSFDRRYKAITCTNRAENITDNMAKQDMEVFKKISKGLTDDQIDLLIKSIDHILSNLNKNVD